MDGKGRVLPHSHDLLAQVVLLGIQLIGLFLDLQELGLHHFF